MVQYYRANLQPTMTPALSRESHHWSTLVDLLLQVARGVDLACQRLKSLEGYAKGVNINVTRQLELIRQEKVSLTSQTEAAKGGKQNSPEDQILGKGWRSKLKLLWRRQEGEEQRRRQERKSRRKRTSEGAKDGVRPGGDDEGPESERGVLGGISSRCAGPSSFTNAEGGMTYLPEGGHEPRIQVFASFVALMEKAWNVLVRLRFMMRRQLTTAVGNFPLTRSRDDIFPLPTSQATSVALRGTLGALNDLSGFGPETEEGEISSEALVIQKNLKRLLERFDIWESPCPPVSCEDLFSSKTVDYCGEEVKVAQHLEWSRVAESLPEGVGLLPLEDFCRLERSTLSRISPTTCCRPDMIKVPTPPAVMV